MRALRTGFGPLAVTIAIAALPAAASAEYLVPPGNSAATQYTEAVPTAGGDRSTEKGRKAKQATPAETLGAGNVRKLDAHGADGRGAAELATATAPSTAAPEEGTAESTQSAGGGSSGGGNGSGGDAAGAGARSGGAPPAGDRPAPAASKAVAIPSGSSGFGEIVAQATGSTSSGQMGLLLPLVILAAIGWSFTYLLRQRKRPTA